MSADSSKTNFDLVVGPDSGLNNSKTNLGILISPSGVISSKENFGILVSPFGAVSSKLNFYIVVDTSPPATTEEPSTCILW